MNVFTVGDTVYAVKNSAWGHEPMVVINIKDDRIECYHPIFDCKGCFSSNDLILSSHARVKALKKLKATEKLLCDLRAKLFGME